MTLLWIFAVLALSDAAASDAPSIRQVTTFFLAEIGTKAYLDCVAFPKNYSVLWVKTATSGSQDLIISINATVVSNHSKYELENRNHPSYYQLRINDVQESDTGKYECRIPIGDDNKITATAELEVPRSPVILDNSTRSVVAEENSSVVLECYARAIPMAYIEWKREGEDGALHAPPSGSIISTNTLKIPRIRKKDGGTYYCMADNGSNKTDTRNISVKVEFKPIVTTQEPTVIQERTFDSLLSCQVESYPPAVITWEYQSFNLTNSQCYEFSEVSISETVTNATLRIKGTQENHFGNYTCIATNHVGHSKYIVALHQRHAPACGQHRSSSNVAADIHSTDTEEFANLNTEELNRFLLIEQIKLSREQFKLAKKQMALITAKTLKMSKRNLE